MLLIGLGAGAVSGCCHRAPDEPGSNSNEQELTNGTDVTVISPRISDSPVN